MLLHCLWEWQLWNQNMT